MRTIIFFIELVAYHDNKNLENWILLSGFYMDNCFNYKNNYKLFSLLKGRSF